MQIERSVKHLSGFLTIALGLGLLFLIAFDAQIEAATCYEDVVVSNAAFEPANATYRFVDFYQYKPRYRRIHPDGTFYPPYENITWGGNRWIIMVGGTNRYEASADTPTPPTIVGCDGCPNPWLRLASVYGPTTITVQGGKEFVSLGGPTTAKLTTGQAYVYAPTVPEGCLGSYTFSIINQPIWMSFDATTGELTGTPTASDVGTFANIQIIATASDGSQVVTQVFAIDVEHGEPELEIVSIEYSPELPSEQDVVTVTLKLANIGTASSQAISEESGIALARYQRDFDDWELVPLSVPALAPGEVETLSLQLSGASWMYHVDIRIGPEGDTGAPRGNLRIQLTGAHLGVSTSFRPEFPTPVDELVVTFDLTNLGQAASNEIDVSSGEAVVILAKDQDIDTALEDEEAIVRRLALPVLSPGDTHRLHIPMSGATSHYWCELRIAYSETRTVILRREILLHRALPDLVIRSMSYEPDTPTKADSITVTAVIENTGEIASAACQLELTARAPTYQSHWNPHTGESEPMTNWFAAAPTVSTHAVPALVPGERFTVTQQYAPAQDNYRVFALIDSMQEVLEHGENPDGSTIYGDVNAQNLLVLMRPAAVDLEIESVTISPEIVVAPGEIQVGVVVRNAGTTRSPDSASIFCYIECFESHNTGESATSVELPLPALDPGETYTVNHSAVVSGELVFIQSIVRCPEDSIRVNSDVDRWVNAAPAMLREPICLAGRAVMPGVSAAPLPSELAWAMTYGFSYDDQSFPSNAVGDEVEWTKRTWSNGMQSCAQAIHFLQPLPSGCPDARFVLRGNVADPTPDELAWAGTHALSHLDTHHPTNSEENETDWIERLWSGNTHFCIQAITIVDLLSPCLEERLVLRGESTTPTQEELDWAAQLGLSYFDTPKPDGATGDEIEWIERVWFNETHVCDQPIAILEPPLDCPAERPVFCYESFDPTEEELAWASAQGLIYWDDGPKPLPDPDPICGIEWIERFWGEYEGDESACTQGIDVISPTPTIAAPADTSVSGCVSVASISPSMTGTATVDDPCGIMVSLEYQDEFHDDQSAELGTFHRVWKVTDQCGDTHRAVQTISIDSPHPYLTSSWAGTFTEGSLVVDSIYIRPQPPIFGNDQAHTLLIVAFAENTAEPPGKGEPVAQTATLTASVDGIPAGSATISVLPGESGLRYEIRVDIPQVPGCHEVSLSMGGTIIYGSVFIHPIGEDPDF